MNAKDPSGNASADALIKELNIFSSSAALLSDPEFNLTRIVHDIDASAERAQLLSQAETQRALVNLYIDDSTSAQRYQAQAEASAFQLGALDGKSQSDPQNPFTDQYLQSAWLRGFTAVSAERRPQGQEALERMVWEKGINVDNNDSQYDLAALRLFELASMIASQNEARRAQELAAEITQYTSENPPSPRRQAEIDRFVSAQASRIARELSM